MESRDDIWRALDIALDDIRSARQLGQQVPGELGEMLRGHLYDAQVMVEQGIERVSHLMEETRDMAHPLSQSAEERHEVREQTESRATFDDQVQALAERIQALGQVQAREHSQEMG
jgi:hypothetical protein